jgi:hypothetical protein
MRRRVYPVQVVLGQCTNHERARSLDMADMDDVDDVDDMAEERRSPS